MALQLFVPSPHAYYVSNPLGSLAQGIKEGSDVVDGFKRQHQQEKTDAMKNKADVMKNQMLAEQAHNLPVRDQLENEAMVQNSALGELRGKTLQAYLDNLPGLNQLKNKELRAKIHADVMRNQMLAEQAHNLPVRDQLENEAMVQNSALGELRGKTLQAHLDNLPGLNQLKNKELRAKIHAMENHDQLYQTNAGKLASDYNRAYARGDKKAMQAINQAMSGLGKQGKLWDALAANFAINSGGMHEMPSSESSQMSAGQPMSSGQSMPSAGGLAQGSGSGMQSNITVPLSSSGNRYSNDAKTYRDANTGKSISVPTRSTVDANQKSLEIEPIVPPLMVDYFNKSMPYMGAGGYAKSWYDRTMDASGHPSKRYSEFSGAQQDLPALVETMLGVFNLPKTSKGVDEAKAMLAYDPLHSPESNAQKMGRGLAMLKRRAEIQRNSLKHGLPLDPNTDIDTQSKQFQKDVHDFSQFLLKSSGHTPPKTIHMGGKVKMMKNGKAYAIAPDQVESALQSGYTRAES